MPEIKHTFTGGKMNKDLDERIVPKDQYVDAMNIQVSTSEESEVGTAQNILGNIEFEIKDFFAQHTSDDSGNGLETRVDKIFGQYAISNNAWSTQLNSSEKIDFDEYISFQLPETAVTIGVVSDEKNDALYYLIWTPNVDYIVAYYKDSITPIPILVDKNKNVLKFDSNMVITGINVIDDMLFWTDNKNEPKKINIKRCIIGTGLNWNKHTLLYNNKQIKDNEQIPLEEKHITVIKKAPVRPLEMFLETSRDVEKIYTAYVFIGRDNNTPNSFPNPDIYDFSTFSADEDNNIFDIKIEGGINSQGIEVDLIDPTSGNLLINHGVHGLTGWQKLTSQGNYKIPVGTKLVFQAYDSDGNPPSLPITDYVIKAEVIDIYPNSPAVTYDDGIRVKIMNIDGTPPVPSSPNSQLKFAIDLYEESEKLFEFKFPRFSYRYKYEDGEYSPFGPFTQVAFSPGSFDYHPRKGYNLGMTNRLTNVHLRKLITKYTPRDVVAIDVLFKDDSSPSVYVVETISPASYNSVIAQSPSNALTNLWSEILENDASYIISKETINSVVPSNQLLRSWDNVPRRALAQDVTGSRIVYGNYVQNYNLTTNYYLFGQTVSGSSSDDPSDSSDDVQAGKITQLNVAPQFASGQNNSNLSSLIPNEDWKNEYIPDFNLEFTQFWSYVMIDGEIKLTLGNKVTKSIKSLREYQLGVVFTDDYGRETPVISNSTGTIKLEKDRADVSNRIKVNLNQDNYPLELSYFKFFVKETAGEYYNMALDRWYEAKDGNVWLAFPSSDRNKIDIDTFLILKKGANSDNLVVDTAKYKVIAIENEAPDYIKTSRIIKCSQKHLPSSIDTDIFGTSSVNAPFALRNEFKMRYSPFHGTAGQDLSSHNFSEDGELYIEFAKNGTTQVSDRYRITSITNDWDGNSQTVDDAEYSIQLENRLKDDVNFISDDPTGNNSTLIEEGAIVNVYKYKVENKPQFDGRFFVKIYSDDIFKNKVKESGENPDNYIVTNFKKVYYMDSDHVSRHTQSVGNFLTDGHSSDNITWNPEPPSIGFFSQPASKDYKYGYYSIDEFTSMALYFRRYLKNSSNDITVLAPLSNGSPGLAHLKPYLGSVLPSAAGTGWTNINSSYLDDNWTVVSNWEKEFSKPGYTANWGGALFEYETIEADNPRDTEVWFIDAGPAAGSRWETHLEFGIDGSGISPKHESPSNPFGVTYEPGIAEPSVKNYTMTLAFGGIKGAKNWKSVTENFFNVGDWNTPTGDGPNPNYQDTDTTEFVSKLNGGYSFRWKEDPTKTIYSIGGSVAGRNRLRHSTVGQDEFLDQAAIGTSMAERLSFNYTRGWRMDVTNQDSLTPALQWNPVTSGYISGGLLIDIPSCDEAGIDGQNTCIGTNLTDDLTIFVKTLSGDSVGGGGNLTDTIHTGMALQKYHVGEAGTNGNINASTHLGTSSNEFLVIRHIEKIVTSGVTFFALRLGGYTKPMSEEIEHLLASKKMPKAETNYRFAQVGMNGYSPNSEFNINTMAPEQGVYGKVGAVGYTLEFVERAETQGQDILSENPAIFETEPKETKDLDIYYEASSSIPMVVNADNIHEAFPVGGFFFGSGVGAWTVDYVYVIGYDGDKLKVKCDNAINISTGVNNRFFRIDDLFFEVLIEDIVFLGPLQKQATITINKNLYKNDFHLPWYNCYSFGNGVESNRIRDNFNLPFISNGVKVSATLENKYQEEHRKYGLIYSGLYNSIGNVNNLNQFIAAEKITKDINPIYGSIQKLHSRNSDLVTLCEDKVLKILANKDAVFNADGNTNLTATENVLGQTIPFVGEYGISTNPESFASESYRAYFADKVRGVILRLSRDGLTPISEAGMKDWFRDNLKISRRIIGSYDDRNDEYNIKLEKYYYENFDTNDWTENEITIHSNESQVVHGISDRNDKNAATQEFFADYVKNINKTLDTSVNSMYKATSVPEEGWVTGEALNYFNQTNIMIGLGIFNFDNANWNVTDFSQVLSFKENVRGWVSFKSFVQMQLGVSMANDYYTFKSGKLYKHHAEVDQNRNTFYEIFTPSTIDVVLNEGPDITKVFTTLNYEGSQSKIDKFKSLEIPSWNGVNMEDSSTFNDQEFYNLSSKNGWYVESIFTNKEDGYINEFLEKEGKWFNYIKKQTNVNLIDADSSDFSFQGISTVDNVTASSAKGWEDDPLGGLINQDSDNDGGGIDPVEPSVDQPDRPQPAFDLPKKEELKQIRTIEEEQEEEREDRRNLRTRNNTNY